MGTCRFFVDIPTQCSVNDFLLLYLLMSFKSVDFSKTCVMKNVLCKCGLLLFLLIYAHGADAQRVAIKSNLLDWAVLSPNLAMELRVSPKLSLDVGVAVNPITATIAGIKATNARLQPELRYWFGRPMSRHYMGVALLGGLYSVKYKHRFYDGDIWAGGLTYGYVFVLSRHWNLETSLGLGVARLRSVSYKEGDKKPQEVNCSGWQPIPMKLGISVSYIFK